VKERPEGGLARQVQGGAPAERRGEAAPERGEGVVGGLLLRGGDRHHAEEQREVGVAVGLHREARAAERRDGLERPLGPLVVAAEVRPPQAGAEREAEDGHRRQAQVDRDLTEADPDRDHRLPDRDQHDEPVPLDEVGDADLELLGRPHERDDEPLEGGRGRPERELGRAAERAADDDQRHRGGVVAPQADHAAHGAHPRGPREEPGVHRDHDGVGEAEGQPAAAEGARDGEGDDEERRHPGEEHDPPRDAVGRHRVGEPRVAGVHPEDHRQHHGGADHPLGVRPARDHAGELGDREDEDQVEEELERRDALDRVLGGGGAHGSDCGPGLGPRAGRPRVGHTLRR
jgi:hypothetical protein